MRYFDKIKSALINGREFVFKEPGMRIGWFKSNSLIKTDPAHRIGTCYEKNLSVLNFSKKKTGKIENFLKKNGYKYVIIDNCDKSSMIIAIVDGVVE